MGRITRGTALAHWLSVCAGLALLLSCVFTPESLPGLVLCPLKRWTGLPCPGCGVTHSFCCISHGEVSRAWAYNPFGFVFYLLAVVLLVWPLLARLFPRASARLPASRVVTFLPPVLVALMLLYGAARICAGW